MTMEKGKKSIRNHLSYVLAEAHRSLHLKFEQQLKSENVQVEHWRVLEILSDEQPKSMGELAEMVLMNHPALTKLIDRMVAQGLVMRGLDPRDNRRVTVLITNGGLALYQKLHFQAEQLNITLLSQIGRERAAELRHLLDDVIKTVT